MIIENDKKLKEASYEKVLINFVYTYENGTYYNNYVTEYADFKATYTSALDVDGNGRVNKTEKKHIYIEK